MNKELYVSSTPHETKVALTEDDQLAEVFFERENEYTLAGSIYKGRVTRVLPGMQSAFVDIGLERDAFLYVSDFLELTGEDDEDGEFGEIPAPRGAIEFGKPQQSQEFQSPEVQTAASVSVDDNDADLEPMFDEETPAPMEGQAESAATEEQEGDGARPWRGRRRRRGGRRGRGNERNESAPETQTAPPEQPAERPEPRPEARYESRPRQDYAPPAGYQPIILPGESISKYRNLSQPAAEMHAAVGAAPAPVEDFLPAEHAETVEEITEEAIHLDQGFDPTETESTSEASAAPEQTEQHASREDEAAPVAETEVAAVKAEEPPRRGRRWGWRRKGNAAATEEAVAASEQSATETQSSEAPERHELEHPNEPAVETPEHHVSESPLFEREHLEANVSSELPAAEQPSESEPSSHPVKSQAHSDS